MSVILVGPEPEKVPTSHDIAELSKGGGGGTIGENNLTQTTAHPITGDDRVTGMYYDWRNRLAASKQGISGTETDGAHRPIVLRD